MVQDDLPVQDFGEGVSIVDVENSSRLKLFNGRMIDVLWPTSSEHQPYAVVNVVVASIQRWLHLKPEQLRASEQKNLARDCGMHNRCHAKQVSLSFALCQNTRTSIQRYGASWAPPVSLCLSMTTRAALVRASRSLMMLALRATRPEGVRFDGHRLLPRACVNASDGPVSSFARSWQRTRPQGVSGGHLESGGPVDGNVSRAKMSTERYSNCLKKCKLRNVCLKKQHTIFLNNMFI